MKQAVRDPAELCRRLQLSDELAQRAIDACRDFPLFVPNSYLARIAPGDPHDPLLRQVLPLADEMDAAEGFMRDPVGDGAATVQPGVLQKYRHRVLLTVTSACAVHCRYCFRRHFPYETPVGAAGAWDDALAAIATDRSIREVILSGGDPLSLVDKVLAGLADRLAAIPHLQRLRLHTRLPIVIPERVTPELVEWLRGARLTPVVVVHANHARELSNDVGEALAALVDAGIPVLNQAVLLRGVNDSVDAQAALWERLVNLRVMPYYLHQLDRVAGAAHFEVPIARGRKIIEQLRTQLPGYAVPRYVQEIAGGTSKTILA